MLISKQKKKTIEAEKWRQIRKSVVQINEQCCIRQNDGKLEKYNWYKASNQRKRLTKL